ncbi:hypothetical protein KUCAC02_004911 [Chaenocephalus aceratus]|uniref:Uncharacterized protein n=1 Tax=Chaenocephalus aceratus TaxID=36190 RepID=A0ACB9X1Q4_CHAAC|nr:hypothetical protein KUCAC02_004911 [Chaenocephalus aceratus]
MVTPISLPSPTSLVTSDFRYTLPTCRAVGDNTFEGFLRSAPFLVLLSFQIPSVREHFVVAVPVAVVAAVGGFLVSHYLSGRGCKKGQVNTCISKDSPKVVHSFDMEDIGTKAVYCRCWKSKKVSSYFRAYITALNVSV